MEFILQEGHGMRGINETFAQKYEGLGIILSPRALRSSMPTASVKEHADELKKQGAKIMFDPEYYIPKNVANQLKRFSYFRNDTREEICHKAIEYQVNVLGVDQLIIPATYIKSPNEYWYDMQASYVDIALGIGDQRKLMSLPLSSSILTNRVLLKNVIERCMKYPIDGFYITVETPEYLVDDREYIYNALEGMLDLVIAGKSVTLGYANQQSLFLAAAGIDAIATGNVREVRRFEYERFGSGMKKAEERKGVWYFDPNSFGEYNRKQLSDAYQKGVKDMFGPECEYCKDLLHAANPLKMSWRDPLPASHYLEHMKDEVDKLNEIGRSERLGYCIERLQQIRSHKKELYQNGFRIGERGFHGRAVNATLAALSKLQQERANDITEL